MPELNHAVGKERDQDQHTERRNRIGHNHEQAPAPAVGKHTAEWTEDCLGQERGNPGCRQGRCRASLLGDPPKQDKLGQRAADQRERLSPPN